MTDIDALDLLAEAPAPALRLLATAIDREFERREESVPSPYDHAAGQLGVHVTDLVVLTEVLEAPVAHSVGHWLFEAQLRWSTEHVGAYPSLPATTETVPGARGDVRAFNAVTMTLPAGTLSGAPLVVRLVPDRFGREFELIGRAQDADALPDVLDGFLRRCRTSDSPYRQGTYRLTTGNRGLVLKRWTPPDASRDLLKLDASVWHTVDRGVHRVLDLAPDLAARGLGTSTGLLLVGPPGTGKTQLGTVVARELHGTTTVLVPGTYVTEHYLSELFDLAADLSPCLILMDDLDLIAGERGQTNPHRLREFLNVMDGGLADRSGVVVIASTNDHRKIDKAARRSSRFDTVIRMEAPGVEGRLAILGRYLAWCTTPLDLPAVARATEGATGADLKELVRSTVLETQDAVTTQALLAQAAEGGWRPTAPAAGDYL
ncbi:ATP-binding protein [Nocardioides sp. QY071]|uniref:AAA family ATPase n=1 Tax=Nocardioides sp. QY071 TaxID=3044187 RepID=UPI00249CA234|nr:ATP-binding protein [Nocardioides sp. QY071]WGY04470.1 ATP-binding protein [Nocardioides sp. QY071]